MALPVITSRNQLQKIPTTALNVRKILSGGTDGDFYTCPTGKKAIIKGIAICTGLGAAATVNLQFAGVTIATWVSGGTADNKLRDDLLVDVVLPYEIQLDAGEVFRYTQNSGTNAEMNVNAEILETPA